MRDTGILLVDADPPRFVSDDGGDEAVELDGSGEPPAAIGDYQMMAPNQVLPILDSLAAVNFGSADSPVRIQSFREAAASRPRYEYDSDADAIVDLAESVSIGPTRDRGSVRTAPSWCPDSSAPWAGRQFRAFPHQREPAHAAAAGAGLELRLRTVLRRHQLRCRACRLAAVRGFTGNALIRALLIVPWPIPVLVSVLIWRSLLNPEQGMIGEFLSSVFGTSPQFFLDAKWTRVALILVNVWLSYPYFYVVTSGALRAIPGEYYDAAEVDGAGPWQRFRYITFPQLLVMVMPLLIASFAFNFNNFNLVYIFNSGNPPMADASIPIGHTDILISFAYKLAFVSSNVSSYGFGAAIVVALCVVIGLMTWFQIHGTRALDEA